MDTKIKKIFEGRLAYMNDQVDFMDAIYSAALKQYTKDKYRIYPHREFCLGSLLIAKSNAKAAVSIAAAGLTYQLHYISRNNIELATNMYYILDPVADVERDKRLKRFQEFSTSVVPYKILGVINQYPEIFKNEQPSAEEKKKKEELYKEFVEKYKTVSGKLPDTQSWSGKKMPELIKSLRDQDKAGELLVLYHLVIKNNNVYVHPSWRYMIESINSHIDRKMDYRHAIGQMAAVFHSSTWIIRKYLEFFSKQRPYYSGKLEKLSSDFISYMRFRDDQVA